MIFNNIVNNTGIGFGTWNAGTVLDDYVQLIPDPSAGSKPDDIAMSTVMVQQNSENLPEEQVQMLQKMESIRDELLKETANTLCRTTDVCALQETSYLPNGSNRADFQVFTERGFEIIRKGTKGYIDCAIAINPKKFDNIENKSFATERGKDYAIAVATEKTTGKKIAFISGHITGFNFEEKDQENLSNQAKRGDDEISVLLRHLEEHHSDCDTLLIGADMNASPEIYSHRFELLTQAGFTLHCTEQPTSQYSRNIIRRNPQPQHPEMPLRKLDYVFIKNQHQKPTNRFMAFLHYLFSRETIHITHITNESLFTLSPIASGSDHIPVVVRVNTEAKSCISRLFAFISASLSHRVRWFAPVADQNQRK